MKGVHSTFHLFARGSTSLSSPAHELAVREMKLFSPFPQSAHPSALLNRKDIPLMITCFSFRWFYHFYLFATIFYASLVLNVIQVYVFRQQPFASTRFLLNTYAGQQRRASGLSKAYAITFHAHSEKIVVAAAVTPESVVLVMTLVLIQVFRRLSECTFLSVYSDAKMNIVHYLFGHSFYFGVGLSVLAEAPGFASQSESSCLHQLHT